MKSPKWSSSTPVTPPPQSPITPRRLQTFFNTSVTASTQNPSAVSPFPHLSLSVSAALCFCVCCVAHKSRLTVTWRNALAWIQSCNSCSVEDIYKTGRRHRDKHKISNPYFLGKGLRAHQKACGRRSGADCMSTFVCQPCKQPKWLSHLQAAGLVCSRPRLRWLPLIFFQRRFPKLQ